MEHAIDALTRRGDGLKIGDVRLDDLQTRPSFVLSEVCSSSDNKIVNNSNPFALIKQMINKMAADKACSTCDKI
jgi:hypothetical protein